MRTNSRARRLALAAVCAGGTIGAAGLVAGPGQAMAATSACSDVYGSGSTLQTILQQATFIPAAKQNNTAFSANCSNRPAVFYNNADGTGTGSGKGLTEFGLQAHADGTYTIDPTQSANGTFLDSFIGTDDPPNAKALKKSAKAAGTNPETIPVVQAPVAIVLNLPAGCSISSAPILRNKDLAAAFTGTIGWTSLLSDAQANPTGCGTNNPTVQVRSDNSGTSFATKQYLSQIDPTDYTSAFINDGTDWPNPNVQTSYNGGTPDAGSGGEAASVANTDGSIGYVNTADAAKAGFSKWAAGADTFYAEVQNNGKSSTSVLAGAYPVSSATNAAKCPTNYSGTVPSGDNPDWENVHVANPTQASGVYPLCTLTYDVAWKSYAATGLTGLYDGMYSNQNGGTETEPGVAQATKDYLKFLTGSAGGQGQAVVPSYYSALPTKIDASAAATVKSYVGQS